MAGKQFTDLTKAGALKDSDIIAVHDGNGLKKASMEDVTAHMSNKFSNPNLLINPDFKINQRGATSYERQGYSVDRWKILNVTVTPNANGGITVKNDKYEDTGTFVQILENATEGNSTLSCYVTSVSGTVTMVADDNSQVILKQGLNVVHTSKSTKNFTIFLNQGTSITLKWVKLEQGSIATPFVALNPSDELMRCKRYFQTCINTFTFIGSDNVFSYATHFSEMRIKPTINTIENFKSNVNSYKSSINNIFNRYYISTQINSVNGAFVLLLLKFELDAEIY